MKIILSPSKTADYQTSPYLQSTEPRFYSQTKKLVATMRKLSKNDLGKALSIRGTLLDETYALYKNFHQNPAYHAFASFNGLVFKQLQKTSYTSREYAYIAKHVRILDALYGLLEPGTLIKPYRLDMKAKLGISLYTFWNIDDAFEDDEVILNLASKEFSQMISKPLITVEFLERKNGTLESLATYSKMGRGALLQYLIQNRIETVEELQQYTQNGYRYVASLSTHDTIVFVR